MIGELTNHLWQSTLFAAIAGLLTLALRNNCARVRYWLWFAAAVKFLIPFSLIAHLGVQFHNDTASPANINTPAITLAVGRISQPFGPGTPLIEPRPESKPLVPVLLLTMWIAGALGILARRWRDWQRVRTVYYASRTFDGAPLTVEVRTAPGLLEPGVVGWLRPSILLPSGIERRLTALELQAVLEHEMCHVRHADNLTAAVQMLVETTFWFHPLVWWLGARLIEERERACDEAVQSAIGNPEAYAEAILKVCRLYLDSPLACVPGVTGSNLRRRIEAILAGRRAVPLSFAKKTLLAGAGLVAAATPLMVPPLRAQSESKLSFDVASVRQHVIKQGSIRRPWTANITCPGLGQCGLSGNRFTELRASLADLLMDAYRVRRYQIANLPNWGDTGHDVYDVVATMESDPAPTLDKARLMLQTLLTERFQLKMHRETRMLPVYALVPAKGGIKLVRRETNEEDQATAFIRSWEPVAELLAMSLDRPVVDKSGLAGSYVTRDGESPFGALQPEKPEKGRRGNLDLNESVFTDIQEKWGLKLEPQKAPVEVLVIDHVQRPTGN